jgi:Zn-dependent protease
MVSNFYHTLAEIAIILPAFLIALSFHEFSHAFVATSLGDNTPKRMGRLTLNPLSHIDPMGLLFLLIFRIGWAKPVVFDPRNFRHQRFYSILTALAGPISNFFLAVVFMYVLKYFPLHLLPRGAEVTFTQIFQLTAYINIMLGVFNLLPIPPLDGSHILTVFLAKRLPKVFVWFYRYSMFILLGIFILPQTRVILIKLIILTETLLRKLIF